MCDPLLACHADFFVLDLLFVFFFFFFFSPSLASESDMVSSPWGAPCADVTGAVPAWRSWSPRVFEGFEGAACEGKGGQMMRKKNNKINHWRKQDSNWPAGQSGAQSVCECLGSAQHPTLSPFPCLLLPKPGRENQGWTMRQRFCPIYLFILIKWMWRWRGDGWLTMPRSREEIQAGLWSLMSQILMVLSDDPVRMQLGIRGLKCRAHTAWSWALKKKNKNNRLTPQHPCCLRMSEWTTNLRVNTGLLGFCRASMQVTKPSSVLTKKYCGSEGFHLTTSTSAVTFHVEIAVGTRVSKATTVLS